LLSEFAESAAREPSALASGSGVMSES
jgi:hypothetical protein